MCGSDASACTAVSQIKSAFPRTVYHSRRLTYEHDNPVGPFCLLCPVCEPDVDDLFTFHRKWASTGKDRPCGLCQHSRGEDFLDLRGEVPNPRKIDASELHKCL